MQGPRMDLSRRPCLFVSDLHGATKRFTDLFGAAERIGPEAVFIGGDLLPHGLDRREKGACPECRDFFGGFLFPGLERLRDRMGDRYPHFFLILGNDDPRTAESALAGGEERGLARYIHNRKAFLNNRPVYGYSFIPPSPFLFKDWEKYDVSRYTDPGCVSPEEGYRSVPVAESEAKWSTIAADLEALTAGEDLSGAIMLFHAPPYNTALDRAGLDGVRIEHVSPDVHAGSLAIRRFIESRRPLITLHGHIHESARLTGSWHEVLGGTHMFSAAHDGPELALVVFDPEEPASAERVLI